MTKVNIREALNQMDKDTDCKYDLVTLYEGYNFNDEEKKEIAKMISDNEDAEVIYDKLSDNFGKEVDFDDDDISDISLEECDMTTDTEEYFDFDELDEDTIKTSKGKWVNKGEEGTHGTFDTKKEADAQRKAMFASGWKGESLKEELKTYYISYKENEGKFKGKYIDLPIKANSKAEAEEKFLKDHPDIKSNDYKLISNTSLKEDNQEDYFTAENLTRYQLDMMRPIEKVANSIKTMRDTHPEYNELLDGLIDEMVSVLRDKTNESLKEASYGGAYDIADDEYFTKEDGMEAANEVVYKLEKEFPDSKLELADMQLDNHSFYVKLIDKDGLEFEEEITLDMRKIRHPLDLIKKYAPAMTERFTKQINDFYKDFYSEA